MRNLKRLAVAASAALLLPYSVAGAAAEKSSHAASGGEGSVLSATTVGAGKIVLHGEVGWPDAGVTGLYGYSPLLDLGGRLLLRLHRLVRRLNPTGLRRKPCGVGP